MSVAAALPRPASRYSWRRLTVLAALGVAAAAAGVLLPPGPAIEAWFLAFVTASGLAIGSLALLTIGHAMGETWLDPIRSEVEAAARTLPILILFGLPLAARLPELYPWATGEPRPDLTGLRRILFEPVVFTARSALYLGAWCAVAFWVTQTDNPRRASAIGLAILVPTVSLAVADWVMSREPDWQSGLFPFAFAISQLLAALAGAIFLSLVRRERPSTERLVSLERALLTLALLALWTWFAQFLIVWLANLPAEAAWYGRRSGNWLWLVGGAAVPALVLAVVLLIPVGVGRRTMLAGSGLVLVQHAAYALWLLRPAAREPALTMWDLAIPAALGLLWTAWFAAAYRRRPGYATEREG